VRLPGPALRALSAAVCTLAIGLGADRPAVAGEEEAIPPQVQSAVDRGLEWLARNQDTRTGAWDSRLGKSTAITALSVMAFMARGHVPGQGPYGENVNKGIDFVLSQQKDNGVIIAGSTVQTMYDHGISTTMLCEAYGMVDEERQEKIRKAVSRSVRLILTAQAIPKHPNDQGGWRYTPTSSDSDISVTGWQLMALRGAANIGAAVPRKAIDDGIAYIKRRAVNSGGFSYTGGNDPNPARTGTGILALELLGQHHSKEALAGGAFLLATPLGSARSGFGEFYYYSVYYCSQAANQLGGKYWDLINKPIRESLLQRQARDGSWPVAQSNEQQGGDAYGTAMGVLALAVPYRYLPIYQR
jgi:hypothetical protein